MRDAKSACHDIMLIVDDELSDECMCLDSLIKTLKQIRALANVNDEPTCESLLIGQVQPPKSN